MWTMTTFSLPAMAFLNPPPSCYHLHSPTTHLSLFVLRLSIVPLVVSVLFVVPLTSFYLQLFYLQSLPAPPLPLLSFRSRHHTSFSPASNSLAHLSTPNHFQPSPSPWHSHCPHHFSLVTLGFAPLPSSHDPSPTRFLATLHPPRVISAPPRYYQDFSSGRSVAPAILNLLPFFALPLHIGPLSSLFSTHSCPPTIPLSSILATPVFFVTTFYKRPPTGLFFCPNPQPFLVARLHRGKEY